MTGLLNFSLPTCKSNLLLREGARGREAAFQKRVERNCRHADVLCTDLVLAVRPMMCVEDHQIIAEYINLQ